MLLEGTYNISGPITVNKANVTIEGMGSGTVFKRMFNSSGKDGVIIVSAANCKLFGFDIDGNSGTYSSSNNCGIKLTGAKYCIVRNVKIDKVQTYGIYLYANANYNRIYCCTITNCATGIYTDYAMDNVFAFNIIDTVTDDCMCIDWSSSRNIILANRCLYAGDSGIKTTNSGSGCVNNTIGHNVCMYSATNININSQYNTVSDNITKQTDNTSDYSILIGSTGTNNLITNNIMTGKNYVNNGGTTNTFENNKY